MGDLQPRRRARGYLPSVRVSPPGSSLPRAGPARSPLTSARRAAHRSARAAGGADLRLRPGWVGSAGTRVGPGGRRRRTEAGVRAGGRTGRAAAPLPASPTAGAGPTELRDRVAATRSSENSKVSAVRIQTFCLRAARGPEGRAQPSR